MQNHTAPLKSYWLILASICLFNIASCDSEPAPKPETNDTTNKPQGFEQIIKFSGSVSFTLTDAEELHRENPDTYWIPPKEMRENLQRDDLVKLVFDITDGSQTQGERMWVLVTGGDKSGYTGILDNDPYSTDQIKAGLEVNFKPKHVIDIFGLESEEEEETN